MIQASPRSASLTAERTINLRNAPADSVTISYRLLAVGFGDWVGHVTHLGGEPYEDAGPLPGWLRQVVDFYQPPSRGSGCYGTNTGVQFVGPDDPEDARARVQLDRLLKNATPEQIVSAARALGWDDRPES